MEYCGVILQFLQHPAATVVAIFSKNFLIAKDRVTLRLLTTFFYTDISTTNYISNLKSHNGSCYAYYTTVPPTPTPYNCRTELLAFRTEEANCAKYLYQNLSHKNPQQLFAKRKHKLTLHTQNVLVSDMADCLSRPSGLAYFLEHLHHVDRDILSNTCASRLKGRGKYGFRKISVYMWFWSAKPIYASVYLYFCAWFSSPVIYCSPLWVFPFSLFASAQRWDIM